MHSIVYAECLSTHTCNMSLCLNLNENLAVLRLSNGRSVSSSLKKNTVSFISCFDMILNVDFFPFLM